MVGFPQLDYGRDWYFRNKPLIAEYKRKLIAKGVRDGTRKMDTLVYRKFPRSGCT